MSWIRDDAEDLINLEHVRSITVVSGEEPGKDPSDTYVVCAVCSDEVSFWLFSGSEEEAKKFRDKIATKLPLVRF